MQIFSLHWMMQNIRLAIVLPHPSHFILSIKYAIQSYCNTPSPAYYPSKMVYFICNRGVGTARQGTPVHKVMTKCSLRHGNTIIK